MDTFAKIRTSIGLRQCKTDPYLFCLFSNHNSLLAMVVVYCDNCIVTGLSQAVTNIKTDIAKQVTISDLRKLKRHLRVDYIFGNVSSRPFIQSQMSDYSSTMVKDFEKELGVTLETFSTPGASVTPPL